MLKKMTVSVLLALGMVAAGQTAATAVSGVGQHHIQSRVATKVVGSKATGFTVYWDDAEVTHEPSLRTALNRCEKLGAERHPMWVLRCKAGTKEHYRSRVLLMRSLLAAYNKPPTVERVKVPVVPASILYPGSADQTQPNTVPPILVNPPGEMPYVLPDHPCTTWTTWVWFRPLLVCAD